MKGKVTSVLENSFSESEIPTELHGIKLDESQRDRLLGGLETGIIEGMVFEDGSMENVKIKAIRDAEGKATLSYAVQKNELEMPSHLLGNKLSEEQVQKLYNGELLHLGYKKRDYYVGVDFELNRITVKNDRELGIPKEFGKYQLDAHDKQRLANGQKTREHVFCTDNGNHYVARLGLTEDKKGVIMDNIKDISKERALEVSKTLNAPMQPEKGTTLGEIAKDMANEIGAKDVSENAKSAATGKKREGFKVLDINNDSGTTSLLADKVITPKNFHGKKLTQQQQQDFDNFKKVELENVTNKHSGKVQNVTIWKERDKNVFKMDWSPVKGKTRDKNLALSKEF